MPSGRRRYFKPSIMRMSPMTVLSFTIRIDLAIAGDGEPARPEENLSPKREQRARLAGFQIEVANHGLPADIGKVGRVAGDVPIAAIDDALGSGDKLRLAAAGDGHDPSSPAAGNPKGVTVVEFFDYRCGYCKESQLDGGLLETNPNVRVVFKELPILGYLPLRGAGS